MYQPLRRTTIARSILDWIAVVCLFASGAFWFSLYYAVLDPPALLSRQAIIAVSMGLVYTLVLPLLWSMLVPSTPAGMLLQKTQHRTWGFVFVIAAALYLTWHGGMLLRLWWLAQPHVGDAQQDLFLTISCLIAFVLVPALAWTQVTPERWLAQVQQAHLVKKIEVMHAADIALAKTAYLRALNIMSAGLANATVAERQEVAGTLKALHLAQNDTLLAIAGTFREIAEIDYRVPGALDDMSISQRCQEVARVLEGTIVTVNDDGRTISNDCASGARDIASERVSNVHDMRPPAPTSTQENAGEDITLEVARRALSAGGWTANDLAGALSIARSTADKLIDEWKTAGHIHALKLRGRYSFEQEA